MQHLPLLQEYLSSWQQGTLRSSPVTELIPAFHEQLGASPALQAARGSLWRASHCPHIKGLGTGPCQEQSPHTLHRSSCSHGVCSVSRSLPSLGLGAHWCSSSPGTNLDPGWALAWNIGACNSPQRTVLGMSLWPLSCSNLQFKTKEQKGWHERNI